MSFSIQKFPTRLHKDPDYKYTSLNMSNSGIWIVVAIIQYTVADRPALPCQLMKMF